MKFLPIVLSAMLLVPANETSVTETRIQQQQTEQVEILEAYVSENLTLEQAELFDREFIDSFFTVCAKENVNPWFALAIMEYESSFSKDAVAWDNAHLGLMQLSTYYFSDDVDDFFDPIQNMTTGVGYLAELKENSLKYKSVKNSTLEYPTEYFVAMSYNEGEGNILENYRAGNVSDYALNVVTTAVRNEAEYGVLNLTCYKDNLIFYRKEIK